ncbi:hypothetical protein D5039_15600 [Verminephrobacter aporrectodeae subsp. tuberculatae]|uniref:Uncharacterized protein n=1 Tax=Verminephrobacter aporrectodeae subsp. tuberculatae TaxID=1110392 RepID=A0ABT3KW75_9BURK|nr:hypothetical protein [Verminephrobacter aporrectodeae subsp. tuberculatae]
MIKCFNIQPIFVKFFRFCYPTRHSNAMKNITKSKAVIAEIVIGSSKRNDVIAYHISDWLLTEPALMKHERMA